MSNYEEDAWLEAYWEDRLSGLHDDYMPPELNELDDNPNANDQERD